MQATDKKQLFVLIIFEELKPVRSLSDKIMQYRGQEVQNIVNNKSTIDYLNEVQIAKKPKNIILFLQQVPLFVS